MSTPVIGKQYTHYKGGRYEVLHFATEEGTKARVIVYKSQADGRVWTRAFSSWEGEAVVVRDGVSRGVERFVENA